MPPGDPPKLSVSAPLSTSLLSGVTFASCLNWPRLSSNRQIEEPNHDRGKLLIGGFVEV
jgi:hypothetical protein